MQHLYFDSSKLTALGRPQSKSNTFTSTVQNWQHWHLNPTPLLQQFKTDSTGTSIQVQHLYFNSSNWQHWDLNPSPIPLLHPFKTDSTGTSIQHLYFNSSNWQHWDLNPSPTPLLQQFKTESTGTSIQHLYFNSSKLRALGRPQSKSNTFTSTVQHWQHWHLNPSPTPLLQQFKPTALAPQSKSNTFTSTVQADSTYFNSLKLTVLTTYVKIWLM